MKTERLMIATILLAQTSFFALFFLHAYRANKLQMLHKNQ